MIVINDKVELVYTNDIALEGSCGIVKGKLEQHGHILSYIILLDCMIPGYDPAVLIPETYLRIIEPQTVNLELFQ